MAKAQLDLTNKMFGRLLVISYAKDSKWLCRCSCGTLTVVRRDKLVSGLTVSCGCKRRETNLSRITITVGDVINNIKVLQKLSYSKTKGTLWECKCYCGKIFSVSSSNLRTGNTKSCGCKVKQLLQLNSEVKLKNQTVNNFTFLEPLEKRDVNGRIIWKVQCICGNLVELDSTRVFTGHTKSCGCISNSLRSTSLGGTGVPYETFELSDLIRHLPQYSSWRVQALTEANNWCQLSNTSEGLHIHHIIPLNVIIKNNAITKENYTQHLTSLFDSKNAFVLSDSAHMEFHTLYGHNTTEKDLFLFRYNYLFSKFKSCIEAVFPSLVFTKYEDNNILHLEEIASNTVIVYIVPELFNQKTLQLIDSSSFLERSKLLSTHVSKLRALGKKIFVLYSSEWEQKQNKIVNFLSSMFGLHTNKLFARNCFAKEITKLEAKQFLDLEHIQGASNGARYFYGLFTKTNELVSVMTFGKHHRKQSIWNNASTIILDRFAVKTLFHIPGAASKLLAFAVTKLKQNNISTIISWSDSRISNGNLYNKLGFTLYDTLKPDYVYYCSKESVENKATILQGKQANKKSCLGIKDSKITELEYTQSIGKFRLYDCGKKVWQYTCL